MEPELNRADVEGDRAYLHYWSSSWSLTMLILWETELNIVVRVKVKARPHYYGKRQSSIVLLEQESKLDCVVTAGDII